MKQNIKKEKEIKIFISDLISKRDLTFDINQLDTIFNEMSTDEICLFWIYYAPQNINLKYDNYKVKKANNHSGKFNIDREDYINHIKSRIAEKIKKSINENTKWENEPFLDRAKVYATIGWYLCAILILPATLFRKYYWGDLLYGFCIFSNAFSWISISIIFFMIKRRNKRKIN